MLYYDLDKKLIGNFIILLII